MNKKIGLVSMLESFNGLGGIIKYFIALLIPFYSQGLILEHINNISQNNNQPPTIFKNWKQRFTSGFVYYLITMVVSSIPFLFLLLPVFSASYVRKGETKGLWDFTEIIDITKNNWGSSIKTFFKMILWNLLIVLPICIIPGMFLFVPILLKINLNSTIMLLAGGSFLLLFVIAIPLLSLKNTQLLAEFAQVANEYSSQNQGFNNNYPQYNTAVPQFNNVPFSPSGSDNYFSALQNNSQTPIQQPVVNPSNVVATFIMNVPTVGGTDIILTQNGFYSVALQKDITTQEIMNLDEKNVLVWKNQDIYNRIKATM